MMPERCRADTDVAAAPDVGGGWDKEMAGLEVNIERCDRLDGAVQAKFASIYESSFPACERDATSSLVQSIESGDRTCDVALLNGDLVGLAVTKPFTIPGTAALEYIAVDAVRRDQGIGALLLRNLRTRFNEGADSAVRGGGWIFEVEPPDASEKRAERDLRRRRIGFYQRNAATIIECAPAYRAPDLERPGTLPYLLMWLPAAPSSAPPAGALLRDLVVAVLIESYELDPEDPLVGQVLDGLVC